MHHFQSSSERLCFKFVWLRKIQEVKRSNSGSGYHTMKLLNYKICNKADYVNFQNCGLSLLINPRNEAWNHTLKITKKDSTLHFEL